MASSLRPIKCVPVNKSYNDEVEANSRLPDFGRLDIQDFNTFMKHSKTLFYDKWSKPNIPSQTPSLADFNLLQLLGSGSTGYVTLSEHKTSKQLYAFKCIIKKVIIRIDHVENLKTEQHLLRCLDYPFTIYLHYTLKDSNYIYFVLPLIEGTDLHVHLKALGKFKEDQARFYASQVILALEYLHYLDFVYRDLKPENILIDHTGYLKLSDFGFSKHLLPRLRTYTMCGTPEYMAPEILLNRGYGKAVDWWSAGVLFYELVAGQTPFVGDTVVNICKNILDKKCKFPKYFSPDLRGLVDNLLQINLSRRYGNLRNGASDIKRHRWLSTINWMAVLNRMVEPDYKPNRYSLKSLEGSHFKLPRGDKDNKYLEEFADF